MKINEVIDLNNTILKCDNTTLNSPPCSRNFNALPLVMNPQSSQKSLLITRDPSNIANSNTTLLGWENTFFRNHILPIFFNDYDKNKSSTNNKYFNYFKNMFSKHVYWTHYSKCFPGRYPNGGHKKPNSECAKRYLWNEINLISPDYIILVGKDSIKFITDLDLLKAISINGNNFILQDNKKIEIISIIHPSNANNACKSDKKYKYIETIEYIQKIISQYV